MIALLKVVTTRAVEAVWTDCRAMASSSRLAWVGSGRPRTSRVGEGRADAGGTEAADAGGKLVTPKEMDKDKKSGRVNTAFAARIAGEGAVACAIDRFFLARDDDAMARRVWAAALDEPGWGNARADQSACFLLGQQIGQRANLADFVALPSESCRELRRI